MTNPKVSIIVPVYNVEKYLAGCLDSILSQTYTNIEVILVDDGSPDNCGQICDEYAAKDSRITVIHKKNEGVSKARVEGYNISKGNYIVFVDSDDTIDSRYVEIMLNELLARKVDMVCCMYYDYNVQKDKVTHTERNHYGVYNKQQIRDFLADDLFFDKSTNDTGIPIFLWAKIFKRELLRDLLSHGIGYWYGEDQIIILSLLYKINSMSVISDKLYTYYHHVEQVTYTQYRADRWDAYYKLWQKLIQLDTDRLISEQLSYKMYVFSIPLFYDSIPYIKDYDDYLKKTRHIFDSELLRKYVFNHYLPPYARNKREFILFYLLKYKLYRVLFIHVNRIIKHIK